MIRAIVGLGNPPAQYAETRHNLGRMAVEAMRERSGLKWKSYFWKNFLWCQKADEPLLVLSKTYMNLSGEAVQRMAASRELKPSEVLILLDDCQLPLGKLRYRKEGSSGGHNGLRSVLECFGTEEVPRLRMGTGIGSAMMAERVLEVFPPEDRPLVMAMTAYLSDLPERLSLNEEKTINEINNWRPPQSGEDVN